MFMETGLVLTFQEKKYSWFHELTKIEFIAYVHILLWISMI